MISDKFLSPPDDTKLSTIITQILLMGKSKFSYKNLAQMKFILPEAVQTEKILLHNNKTLSVEHDIKVALNFDVVEGHIEHSDYIALSHAFSSRLFKLVNKHVEKRFSAKAVDDSAKTELLPSPVLPSSIKTDTTTDNEVIVYGYDGLPIQPVAPPSSDYVPGHVEILTGRNTGASEPKGWNIANISAADISHEESVSNKANEESSNEALIFISEDDCIDLDGMERSILAKIRWGTLGLIGICFYGSGGKRQEFKEPFNQREITVSALAFPVDSSNKTLPNIAKADLLNPSHLPPSFKKRFSAKAVYDSAKTELLPSPLLPSSIKIDTTTDNESAFTSNFDPVKHEKPLHVVNAETPIKNPVIPKEISVETPDVSTPRRSVPTEDKKLKSLLSQKAMTNSSFTKRSLNFLNDDEGELLEGKTTSAGDPYVKVEDTEKDLIAQSGLKPFQPTSDCLTDMVKTIHNISRSIQCSFITQSELVYKILGNNLDIVEREEIEEHLEVLVNKVPDSITKKVDLSGRSLCKGGRYRQGCHRTNELVYKILVNNLDIVEREEIEEHLDVLVNKVPHWITKKVDLSWDSLYYFNKGMGLKSVTEMLT
nr:hypothetical protein [Tanacetum cinerariifolium]